jgi:SAM-dependent methyltransferase
MPGPRTTGVRKRRSQTRARIDTADGAANDVRITRENCPVCGGAATSAGVRRSRISANEFNFARCADCRYVFVRDPRVDFAALYDADYYAGRGADYTVDYLAEMADPRTVRVYEWRGITRIVGDLVALGPTTRWLDYGSGLGGLVRYVEEQIGCSIVGFEEGYAGEWTSTAGVPHIERGDLVGLAETFEVVTAIEMLEHTLDPVAVLREMRDLLRPGGLLFVTTGNAEPHRDDITRWKYTSVPDVHIGFFEPRTLATALERAGFEVLCPGRVDGLDDVIRFKVLKNLRLRRSGRLERILPWGLIGRIVDARHGVSAMPCGRRPA